MPINTHFSSAVSLSALEQASLQTVNNGLSSRPERTKIAYKGPKKEFIDFCDTHSFLDLQTVTESKLNLFLRDHVLGKLVLVLSKGVYHEKVKIKASPLAVKRSITIFRPLFHFTTNRKVWA